MDFLSGNNSFLLSDFIEFYRDVRYNEKIKSGVMKELAKDYMKENPNATVQIQVTDSTSGLTAAMQNSCDFAMASRDLKDISLKQLKQVFTGEIHSLNEEEQ